MQPMELWQVKVLYHSFWQELISLNINPSIFWQNSFKQQENQDKKEENDGLD